MEEEQRPLKKLYLIRHAKSSWSNPSLADFDRGLNKRGKKDAPFMGERLARYGVRPDRILSSPAKRAKKTARIVAEAVGYPKEMIAFNKEIYSTSASSILRLLRSEPDGNSVLFLVGHNPVITELAELLTNRRILNIPTCGIAAVVLPVSHWREISPGSGELEFFDYPKKHAPGE